MTKEVRSLWLLGMLAAFAISNGCKHKPAYSEMDPSKTSSTQNRNSEAQTGSASSPAAAETPGTGAGQPAGSAPVVQQFKNPPFIDQATGAIKDLPDYPRSARAGTQIGPNQGLNVIMLSLQTGDSMDQIVSFYQKVIADNRWTVADKTLDPDLAQWILTKGTEDTARIQVKKDPASSSKSISIVRGVKIQEPGK
jgi:hypothetical protein